MDFARQAGHRLTRRATHESQSPILLWLMAEVMLLHNNKMYDATPKSSVYCNVRQEQAREGGERPGKRFRWDDTTFLG